MRVRYKINHPRMTVCGTATWNKPCLFEQRKLASKKIIEPTDIMVN